MADALRVRRRLRVAVAVLAAYLIVYLWAIQNLVISPRTDFSRFVRIPSIQVAADWTSTIFRQRAAFYYEPVVAIYPINHVAILISPVNVAMGLALATLVALNVAMTLHLVSSARACHRRAFAGLLGALPGFLTGFACCVPTIALVLGAQFTLALIVLRAYFFPFAPAALAASVALTVLRAEHLSVDDRLARIVAPPRVG